jgi:pSer/pThr/pTyr-binding forkhead associated (FHA) protein
MGNQQNVWLVQQAGPTPSKNYKLTSDKITLGRADDNDIVFDVSSISRYHAQIRSTAEGYVLRDLEAANGTFVNKQRLNTPYLLRSGDIIGLGYTISLQFVDKSQVANRTIIETIPDTRVESPQVYRHSNRNTLQEDNTEQYSSPSKALTVTPSKAVVPRGNEVQRTGCAFCFYTLNPADPEPTLRTFVKASNSTYYHKMCWEGHPKETLTIQPVTIPMPTPLSVAPREAVILGAGPTNSLQDEGVGISVGTLKLGGERKKAFQIQNNSADKITIRRCTGPMWTYVDFGGYNSNAHSAKFTLWPDEQRTVYVVGHSIRPSWMQIDMPITNERIVELETNGSLINLVLAIVGFVILAVLNANALSGWVNRLVDLFYFTYSLNISDLFGLIGSILMLYISTLLVAGWFVLLMPSYMRWFVYDVLASIKNSWIGTRINTINQIMEYLQSVIYHHFSTGHLAKVMQKWSQAIPDALICGAILAIPITCGLMLLSLICAFILRGFAPILLFLAYSVLLFFLLYRVLLQYNIDLYALSRRLTKR